MDDRQKEVLRRQLSPAEVTHRYQQAVKYFVEGGKTGIMDKAEYDTFVDIQLKRDFSAAAHAWFGMVITWQEYHDLIQALIGFDLMILGAMEDSKRVKSNGEDKDKEVDVDGDLMGLTPEENE